MRAIRRLSLLTAAIVSGACSEPVVPPTATGNEVLVIVREQGDQQIGTVGMALPARMAVRVQDASGRGRAGVAVRFAVHSGGGWIEDTEEMLTDGSGVVSTVWHLGPRPGSNILTASSAEGGTGFRASATELVPGQTYVGTDSLVVLSVGELPVILLAGHGGTRTPAGVPGRDDARPSDTHTAELAAAINDALETQTGSRATVLTANLARSRVDVDGPLPTTSVNAVAQRTWLEYHGMLSAARMHLQDREIRGLIVDVHGHASTGDAVQLGYLLTREDLAEPDVTLNGSGFTLKSSIRDVARGQISFARIVRGDASIGGLLAERGFAAVPSPAQPSPAAQEYLGSSFSAARYGSQDGSLVSAMVLQAPAHVRDSPAARLAFSAAFAEALDRYFGEYLGSTLSSR